MIVDNFLNVELLEVELVRKNESNYSKYVTLPVIWKPLSYWQFTLQVVKRAHLA